MGKTIQVLWDGEAFRPDEPPSLEPNTRLQITYELPQAGLPPKDEAVSFLQMARSLNLEGPPDWSANIEEYLNRDAMDNHEE